MPSVIFWFLIKNKIILTLCEYQGQKSVVGLVDDGAEGIVRDDLLTVINCLLACERLRNKLLNVDITKYWYCL